MICQPQNMARVARRHGDKQTAAALERVAQWARTFKGHQAQAAIGPNAPSLAMEHGRATGEALERAAMICESYRLELVGAWRAPMGGGRHD